MSRERIAATVAKVKASTPELVPFLQELQALGMITGGSCISYVGPHRPEPLNSVHVGQMVIESTEAAMKRMKLHGNR